MPIFKFFLTRHNGDAHDRLFENCGLRLVRWRWKYVCGLANIKELAKFEDMVGLSRHRPEES